MKNVESEVTFFCWGKREKERVKSEKSRWRSCVWKTIPSEARVTRDVVSGWIKKWLTAVWKTVPKRNKSIRYCLPGSFFCVFIYPEISSRVTLASLGIGFQPNLIGMVSHRLYDAGKEILISYYLLPITYYLKNPLWNKKKTLCYILESTSFASSDILCNFALGFYSYTNNVFISLLHNR